MKDWRKRSDKSSVPSSKSGNFYYIRSERVGCKLPDQRVGLNKIKEKRNFFLIKIIKLK